MKEANFVKIFESKKNCSKKIFKTVKNVKVFSMISFFFFEGWGGEGEKYIKMVLRDGCLGFGLLPI